MQRTFFIPWVFSFLPQTLRRKRPQPPSPHARAVYRDFHFKKLIATVLILFFCLLSTEARAAENRKILVLYSFHLDSPSTEALHAGLKSVLAKSGMGLEVIHEFLDARRYAGPEYESRLSSLMQHKYAGRQFDAIITAGNYAYRFFAEHRQDWFGSTPWVFCGVNDRAYERHGDDPVGSTGLTVKLDIAVDNRNRSPSASRSQSGICDYRR